MNYLLTGFSFLPLVRGGTAFLAVEDDGCVVVANCWGCMAGGGAGKTGTDWDVFCLLRPEVVGLGIGSCIGWGLLDKLACRPPVDLHSLKYQGGNLEY